MTAANFDKSLDLVLKHEGGFVNHPRDPGGATNKGVTQAVYDQYRLDKDLPRRTVKLIESTEVTAIYRRQYWNRIRGDDLPAGVDYAIFDFAVNSGVSRASRFLQTAVGVPEDAIIGPKTIAAIKSPSDVIDDVCDHRMKFLRSLGTFDTFGKGWTRRVTDVRSHAKAMLA